MSSSPKKPSSAEFLKVNVQHTAGSEVPLASSGYHSATEQVGLSRAVGVTTVAPSSPSTPLKQQGYGSLPGSISKVKRSPVSPAHSPQQATLLDLFGKVTSRNSSAQLQSGTSPLRKIFPSSGDAGDHTYQLSAESSPSRSSPAWRSWQGPKIAAASATQARVSGAGMPSSAAAQMPGTGALPSSSMRNPAAPLARSTTLQSSPSHVTSSTLRGSKDAGGWLRAAERGYKCLSERETAISAASLKSMPTAGSMNVFDLLTVNKKEQEEELAGLASLVKQSKEAKDPVIIISSDEDSCGVDSLDVDEDVNMDSDEDLLRPIANFARDSNSKEPRVGETEKTAKSSENVAAPSSEYVAPLACFPKEYTLDVICQHHKQWEKAKEDQLIIEDLTKSGGFRAAALRESEKDAEAASASNDQDQLIENQETLAKLMSVPASTCRSAQPGHAFCSSRVQRSLFSESTCHSLLLSELGVTVDKSGNDTSARMAAMLKQAGARDHMLINGYFSLISQIIENKKPFLDYLFRIVSCHPDAAVVNVTARYLATLTRPCQAPSPDFANVSEAWYPTAALIFSVVMNFGIDLYSTFSFDEALVTTVKSSLRASAVRCSLGGTQSGGQTNTGDSTRDVNDNSLWPAAHNISSVLDILSCAAAYDRNRYSEDEVEAMVVAAVALALDVRFRECHIGYNMHTFLKSMLGILAKDSLHERANSIVRKLALLTAACHHHARVHAVQLFAVRETEELAYVRCRLAYAILQQLLFDATDFDDIGDLNVKMLQNVEQSIVIPSTKLEGDPYVTMSLLNLLFYSIDTMSMNRDKEQIELQKIVASLKSKERKIRCCLRQPDLAEVKNKLVIITSRWTSVLDCASDAEQTRLFYDRDDAGLANNPFHIERVSTREEPMDDEGEATDASLAGSSAARGDAPAEAIS